MSHYSNQSHSRNVHLTNAHHPEPSSSPTTTGFYGTNFYGAAFPSTGFYSTGITVLLSAMLPLAALYRAVSASASSIVLLFIYWKFHVTDGQNRSLFFGVKCMPTSFPILPILFLPFTASSPTQPQHRHIKVLQDLQYIIERNWPVKKNS